MRPDRCLFLQPTLIAEVDHVIDKLERIKLVGNFKTILRDCGYTWVQW